MFSLLWLGQILAVAKAHFMWIIFTALMATIAWQHHSIGNLKEEMQGYQAQAARAEAELSECEGAYATQEESCKLRIEYYKNFKQLEEKEGPVLPDIFKDLKQK